MLSKFFAPVILVCSIAVSDVSFACDCFDGGPFLIVAKEVPVVVRGKVISHVERGFDFEVQEVYQGQESRQVIRIWGDPGWMCRKNASEFQDDSEWVIALDRISDRFRRENELLSDFEVSSCGEYAVPVDEGEVITFDEYGRERRVSIIEISDRLPAWPNIE